MKLILSRHYTPESHWTKWPEEGFDFSDYSQPWEHPGVSRLAYETKATYGDLDYDGDGFLRRAVEHYWAPDIASRRGDLIDDLVDMAEEFVELTNIEKGFMFEELGIGDVPKDWLEKVGVEEIDSEHDGLYEYTYGKYSTWTMEPDHAVIIDYLRKYLRPRIGILWKKMIPLIIKENYAPKHDYLVDIVAEDSWAERVREWSDTAWELLTPEYKEKFFEDPEIHFEEWAKSNSYHAAVITYPGENLLSYFHDEIVFQCYIQMTVEHDREPLDNYGLKIRVPRNPETEFVTSRQLLDRPETLTDEDFEILVDLSHGWWS